MMKASLRIAVALAALLSAQQATALGLGKARVESDMSAPLRISIPIAGFAASGIDIEALQVNVPGYLDQATLGVPDTVMPQGVKTVVSSNGRGGAVVRMSTQTAVREPVLRFALRASWPGGEVVKTYELIIDPPFVAYPRTSTSTTVAVRPATASASQQPTSPSRVAAAQVSARAGASFGPVAGGDTLYPIARSAYPQLSTRVPQVMAVLVERNPDAFIGGDANQLLRGATLTLPTASDMQQALSGATRRTPSGVASNAITTYTVAEGDTLYAITRRVLGITEGQLPPTVAQIHASNPQAFENGDMNRLQVGAVLQLGANPNNTVASVANTPEPNATSEAQTPSQVPSAATANEVSGLTAQLAQAEESMATQRQVQTELNARLAALTETLQALRERDAKIAEQSQILARELQDKRVATEAMTADKPAPISTAVNEPITTVTASQIAVPIAVAATTAVTPTRAAPSASEPESANMISFVESSMSGSMMWAGVGALILALLAAVFAIIRQRKVAAVATQPRTGRADEDAARDKLAEVRERFSESGRFIAEPLQEPDKDSDKGSGSNAVHMTDAAHASRFAKEAAVHLAYGDLPAARNCIEEAIRLDPHRDEHKMVLVTVLEGMGEQAKAREIIDEMLTRREELSGELRSQAEQLKKKTAG